MNMLDYNMIKGYPKPNSLLNWSRVSIVVMSVEHVCSVSVLCEAVESNQQLHARLGVWCWALTPFFSFWEESHKMLLFRGQMLCFLLQTYSWHTSDMFHDISVTAWLGFLARGACSSWLHHDIKYKRVAGFSPLWLLYMCFVCCVVLMRKWWRWTLQMWSWWSLPLWRTSHSEAEAAGAFVPGPVQHAVGHLVESLRKVRFWRFSL